MTTVYRVLGICEKYRFVMCDFTTQDLANAAVLDQDNITAWNAQIAAMPAIKPCSGFEVVERNT